MRHINILILIFFVLNITSCNTLTENKIKTRSKMFFDQAKNLEKVLLDPKTDYNTIKNTIYSIRKELQIAGFYDSGSLILKDLFDEVNKIGPNEFTKMKEVAVKSVKQLRNEASKEFNSQQNLLK